jgi:hypothetical protein
MAQPASFRSGEDSPLRVHQIDGQPDIISEEGEARPFDNDDMFLHGNFLTRHHSNSYTACSLIGMSDSRGWRTLLVFEAITFNEVVTKR